MEQEKKEPTWDDVMKKCPERFYAFYEIFNWLKTNYDVPKENRIKN